VRRDGGWTMTSTAPDTIQTPMDATVSERVRSIIATFVTPGQDEAEIIAEETRLQDLGADSLDCAELLLAIEAEFLIDIADERFANVETVKDVIDLVTTTVAEVNREIAR